MLSKARHRHQTSPGQVEEVAPDDYELGLNVQLSHEGRHADSREKQGDGGEVYGSGLVVAPKQGTHVQEYDQVAQNREETYRLETLPVMSIYINIHFFIS